MTLALRAIAVALLAALPATAVAQSANSVESRLQRAEDELAIKRIIVDYAARLDARDYKGYVAMFTPQGEWSNRLGSHKGPVAIHKMLSALGPEGAVNTSNYHLVSNPRVEVNGDRATATSRYLFVMRGKDGSPRPALAGLYADELVRQSDGSWKIRRRVANDVMPTREEWAKIIAAERAGQ
jgi:ketosteroid isomerase-like protein